ncbi:TPA: hypothetical protein ACGCQJ_005476, partial [Escherichia coli]|nr:hypothetical protein [Escherichia coli]
PQNAAVSARASEFTPSRVSLDGALYCACERQRTTGAIAHYSVQALILCLPVAQIFHFAF